MTIDLEPDAVSADESTRQSLGTAAARNLATTTKTTPKMQEITPRWLLRRLPWEKVTAGTYRVNRRLSYPVGNELVGITTEGQQVRVIPQDLCEFPLLREFGDEAALTALADEFRQRELGPGEVIVEAAQSTDRVVLIAHGKVNKIVTGKYGDDVVVDVLSDGEFFGEATLAGPQGGSGFTYRTITACTVLELSRDAIDRVEETYRSLREHVQAVAAASKPATNKRGEALIELASGHEGELPLPGTFVDYETKPREYGLSVAQTVVRFRTGLVVGTGDPGPRR